MSHNRSSACILCSWTSKLSPRVSLGLLEWQPSGHHLGGLSWLRPPTAPMRLPIPYQRTIPVVYLAHLVVGLVIARIRRPHPQAPAPADPIVQLPLHNGFGQRLCRNETTCQKASVCIGLGDAISGSGLWAAIECQSETVTPPRIYRPAQVWQTKPRRSTQNLQVWKKFWCFLWEGSICCWRLPVGLFGVNQTPSS